MPTLPSLPCVGVSSRRACDGESLCTASCEYGYQLDEAGCPTCTCDDPCQELTCPEASTCVMRTDPGCEGPQCSAVPMCKGVHLSSPPFCSSSVLPFVCLFEFIVSFFFSSIFLSCDVIYVFFFSLFYFLSDYYYFSFIFHHVP